MASHDYHLVTRWRFQTSAEAVFALISRPLEFPRWWGSVYLKAEVVEKGDAAGIDRLVHFVTKGALPYRLRWGARTLSMVPNQRIDIRASGDFEGDGIWLLEEDGIFVDVIFDWRVRAEKTLIRQFSWLFRPLFKSNHRWAMEQGRRGIERELASQQIGREGVKVAHVKALAEKPLVPALSGGTVMSGMKPAQTAGAAQPAKAKGQAAGR